MGYFMQNRFSAGAPAISEHEQLKGPVIGPALNRRQLLQSAGAAAVLAGSTAAVVWPTKALAQVLFSYDLDIVMAPVDDPELKLRTYNGMSPGPTMDFIPGSTLQVNLTNSLPTEDPSEICTHDPNTFHGSNITNFHTHGLHVAPDVDPISGRDSDNIFLRVTPPDQEVPCSKTGLRIGGTEFNFSIPETHPPGTFWYHAHKHGSTAQQVANGLAGPLIVRDPDGFMPDYIANAKEDIFMIQQRNLTEDSEDGKGGDLRVVLADPDGGGEVDPTMVLRPGEIRRWRFINAAPSADAFVSLNFDGGENAPELWQIAFDGLTLPERRKIDPSDDSDPWVNPAAMAPGNRMDVLVRVPGGIKPGSYQVAVNKADESVLHEGHAQGGLLKAASPVGLNIVVEGDPVEDTWSDDPTLPGPGQPDISLEEAADTWKAEFFLNTKTGAAMINNKSFDGDVHKTMKLGTVEEWTVENKNPFTHPFHIHVNPFLVTHIDGVELAMDDPLRRWQDTLALPVSKKDADGNVVNGSVKFLSRYTRFTGKFVIHCHILRHEDEGMMQAVEVVSS